MSVNKSALFLFAVCILLLSGIPLILEPGAYYIIREELYFNFFSLLSVLSVSIYFLYSKDNISFCLNRADLFFLLFVVYAILRSIFITPNKTPQDNFLNIGLLAVLYLFFKHVFQKDKEISATAFITVMIIAGYIELISSYLQWFNIMPNLFPFFKFGGTLGNPGPFTIYLAAIDVILVNYILQPGENIKTIKKILIYLLLLFSIIIIAVSKIRASWIALVAGAFLVISFRFGLWSKFRQLQLYKRLLLTGGCCVLMIFFIVGLLTFKKDSASGRVFIWKNTINLIKDRPLFGVGYKNYIYNYNNFQSSAFLEGNYSEKDYYQADNVSMAFNDYLQITAEFGIIGLLLFIAVLFYTARSALPALKRYSPFTTGIVGCVAALLCASLFSYPLTILRIQVLFVLCLAMLSAKDQNNIISVNLPLAMNRIIVFILGLTGITILLFNALEYNKFRRWNNASKMYDNGHRHKAMQEYHTLYNSFKDYSFLFNYSSVLVSNGLYYEAMNVLDETGEYLNTYDYFLSLGDCYLLLNNPGKAEEAYVRAMSIIPSRIMPRYCIFKCAIAEKNSEKIQTAGKEILECKIKIENDLTKKIREETAKYLNREKEPGKARIIR